ncbi:hypothetical protein C0992_000176 [Termitomyces sp. T32_za158]|nr:hypothetical protein C0992_000176 [Termitomyces sp. T32_za158]
MRFSGFLTRLTGALTILSACTGSSALLPSTLIFPLYIYPGTGCTSWAPLLTAIPLNPTLQFLVVVNPNSGPGPAGSQPDANYQACVAQLRMAGAVGGNVKMIGYVSTAYGARDASAVTADIDTYAGWAAAYRVEGIFFDEAATDSGSVSKYQSYASRARTQLGSSAFVTLNPGTWSSTSSASYFTFADLIATFENTYNSFTPSAFPDSASTPRNKQAAFIHTGPTSAPIAMVQEITQTLGLKASFYSDLPNTVAYNQFPTSWPEYPGQLVLTQV